MIIGITGKSGTGKSYVAQIIAEKLEMLHVDIDKISHEVLELKDTKHFLLKTFGNDIFEKEKLNRKKLGKIVFNNAEKLSLLNEFCQTQMEKKIDEIISSSTKSVILDYALLCGLKQFEMCDITILLTADFETRFARVSKRENISKEYFISRDNSIENLEEFKFDYTFNNISQKEIDNLISQLKIKENLW